MTQEELDEIIRKAKGMNNMLDMAGQLLLSVLDDQNFEGLSSSYTGGQ